jgi:SAM-dependent methyltransferase
VAADQRTIRDFGEQWTHYGDNEGYYGSLELLRDMLGPLLDPAALRGARVADVGSGAGRIVRMLLEAGAARVWALEPSQGVEALRANTRDVADRVEILHAPGEALPAGLGLDFVTAIGVIPFVRDPAPLLAAARAALRPGGRLVVWVYGVEGNRVYLGLLRLLRPVTTRLPHAWLDALCRGLDALLGAYIALCRWLPLPLRDYARHTLARVSRDKRRLTLYDQLNPTYVRFYRGDELRELLAAAGFREIRLHHRRGYSWTAVASA